MISIHLRRTGAKKDPHYRVVVTDSRVARDGAFIEVLGHYHPRFEPAKVVLDVQKTKAWIDKGAQPSDTVRSLLRKVESGTVDTQPPVAPSRQRAAPGSAAEGPVAPPAAESAVAGDGDDVADSAEVSAAEQDAAVEASEDAEDAEDAGGAGGAGGAEGGGDSPAEAAADDSPAADTADEADKE